MSKLTYSLCYNPKHNVLQNNNINFVCSDKKIHVRLRDFNGEQVVKGFERKLAYLFTYLINYSNIASIATVCDKDIMLKALCQSADSKEILRTIRSKTLDDTIKGFDVAENYRKKDCNPFGNTEPEAFPVIASEKGVPAVNDLHSFLNILRIDLENYLFNDGYYLVIYEDREVDINKKYNNKAERKKRKVAFVELW